MVRPRRPWLKPHLVLVRGLWCVYWRDGLGQIQPRYAISFMTKNSKAAKACFKWAAARNAGVIASRGPWNCRCLP